MQRVGVHWEVYSYWVTHQGAELFLLIRKGRRKLGFEFKRTSAPGITPSMRIAQADLRLDRLLVIHPGEGSYPFAPRIRAVSFEGMETEIHPLR